MPNMRHLLILALMSPVLTGSSMESTSLESQVDDFVETVLGCRNVVGMNLAIVHNDVTLLTKGYGYKNLETRQTVSEDTLFSVASLTKAFADTLLGTLLEENGLSWDTPVRDILGEDFYFSDGLRSNRSTVRDLAAHRMGVPGHNMARLQGFTRETLAQKLRFFPATEQFRTTFRYNNLMYGLIAHLTEKVGGSTWEELLQDRLFTPLGMNSTTFTHASDIADKDMATPYLDYEGGYREISLRLHSEWGVIGGTASIVSNARDMAKWLHLHLSGGLNEAGERVIPLSVLEETYDGFNGIPQGSSTIPYKQPVIPVTYDHGKYGLGWRLGYYRGLRMVMHTGSSWGFTSQLTMLPDVKMGIYTSMNGPDDDTLARRTTHMYIMDLLLRDTPWLNLTTACTFPEPWYDETSNSKFKRDENKVKRGPARIRRPSYKQKEVTDLTLYEGTYGNFGYGNISVEVNSNGTLELHYGDLGLWYLTPDGEDHFYGHGQLDIWSLDIADVQFRRSPPGSDTVNEVELSLESRDPPVFIRDLDMNDAPPPPDPTDCSTGGSTHQSHNGAKKNSFTTILITSVLVVMYLIVL